MALHIASPHICFLLLCNKLPQTQCLKTIPIYYLTVSMGQESRHDVLEFLCCDQGVRQAAFYLNLGVLFQAYMVVCRIHFLAAVEFMWLLQGQQKRKSFLLGVLNFREARTLFERDCLIRSGLTRIISLLFNSKSDDLGTLIISAKIPLPLPCNVT